MPDDDDDNVYDDADKGDDDNFYEYDDKDDGANGDDDDWTPLRSIVGI